MQRPMNVKLIHVRKAYFSVTEDDLRNILTECGILTDYLG